MNRLIHQDSHSFFHPSKLREAWVSTFFFRDRMYCPPLQGESWRRGWFPGAYAARLISGKPSGLLGIALTLRLAACHDLPYYRAPPGSHLTRPGLRIKIRSRMSVAEIVSMGLACGAPLDAQRGEREPANPEMDKTLPKPLKTWMTLS